MKKHTSGTSFRLSCALLALLGANFALAGGSKRGKLDPEDPKIAEKVAEREGVEMVAHQLLVKFKSENAAGERQKIFKELQGREIERVGSTPLFLVQFPEEVNINDVKTKLEHHEGISYAEPNLVMRTMPAKKKNQAK
ncbi:MAG TPA: hypothetical protein VM901_07515 [Bdellovibrionota bacterium]|jgi:hypothetical protein|nr:hypothetical protein [Bdellovibrionota bacterium]